MNTRVYAIVAFVAGAYASLSNADTLQKIRDTQTIVIANREASVPFSYLDDNKKPVGYAVDLCLKIAEGIKKELKLSQLNIQFLTVDTKTRIPSIVDGKADLECGSTTNNAERRKQVAFTIPHFVASVKTLVRADSGIKNWPDLQGKRVVTTVGTTTVKLLNDRDKVRSLNLKLLEGSDHNKSFAMVESNQADAFTMDDVLLYGLRATSKDPTKFAVVGDMLSTEPYAIMMRKDDPAFKSVVDREMARLINDGEMGKAYEKWFMKPIPPKQLTLNMPMSFLLKDIMRFPTDKVAD